MTVEELTASALRLSDHDRAALAHRLLESLDPGEDYLSGEEWTENWGTEVRRRLAAFRNGDTEASDWSDALDRMRGALGEGRGT
ncbi:MAG: addiction module protein [Planctomycetes bacterium]|nr:addiction module protein [Planctomycetota bacterium]